MTNSEFSETASLISECMLVAWDRMSEEQQEIIIDIIKDINTAPIHKQ
jgi:hypothetical protein